MKTITIKSGRLGRYDDVSPFLVESGDLELRVNLPQTNGEFFLVAELNGVTISKTPIPADGKVSIAGLEAGELAVEVKHYLRGELIECFKVEPILLKQIDVSISAMPEIAELKAENAALRKEIADLSETNAKAFAELKNLLHLQTIALLSYAYAEYENDVQLNSKGLSAEEFVEALGYPLNAFTAEEMNEIKTKKEKL